MPKLSDSEADVVIIRWLKVPGEGFRRGEALLEVETDKATVVYEAEDEGTLETILVSEGESAAVGQPIARLAGSGSIEEPSAPGVSNGSPEDGVRPNATPVARTDRGRARPVAARRRRDRPRRKDHEGGRSACGGDCAGPAGGRCPRATSPSSS